MTQMTMLLPSDSFRLSLIFIWQMFNCLNERSKSGVSCGDLCSERDIICHSDIQRCNHEARLFEIWRRTVNAFWRQDSKACSVCVDMFWHSPWATEALICQRCFFPLFPATSNYSSVLRPGTVTSTSHMDCDGFREINENFMNLLPLFPLPSSLCPLCSQRE